MALPLEQFTQRVAESGLVSAADVQALVASLGAGPRPKDGEQLARLLVRGNKLTAFQAQQLYQGKGKHLVLGNYLVLDKLGQGGMGMVLKARHRRMKRLVALKVLSPAVTKTPEAQRRFQREVEAAAKLTHPNIVTAPNYYAQFQDKPALDPSGPSSAGAQRVVRCGYWHHQAFGCRASDRFADDPTHHGGHLGFRVALTVDAVQTALRAEIPQGPYEQKR